MKTLFYISIKKINKKGLVPIYCRITINGRRCEISTGIWINPQQWKNESLIETNPDNIPINSTLAKIKTDIQGIYYELVYKEKTVTSEIVKEIYTGKSIKNHSFIELIEEFISYKQQTIKEYNTVKSFKSRRALIVEFLTKTKRKQILPEDFNIKMADLFTHHLLAKKLKGDYVNRQLSFIKSALNYAVRMEIIKFNPIASITFKHDPPKAIISLSKDELLKLSTHKFESQRLQQVADMYIFQSFTGFAYVDLFDFDYLKHVKIINGKEWIFKSRVKNNIEAIIPMFSDAKRILKKYKFKLPIVSNQKYNEYLKEITSILKIPKALTTHTARKTFAMIRLNDGFSIESVARMMGHNSIKITQSTYAQVGIERINNEFIKIGFNYKK
jgi:site-specific recombinase XerD